MERNVKTVKGRWNGLHRQGARQMHDQWLNKTDGHDCPHCCRIVIAEGESIDDKPCTEKALYRRNKEPKPCTEKVLYRGNEEPKPCTEKVLYGRNEEPKLSTKKVLYRGNEELKPCVERVLCRVISYVTVTIFAAFFGLILPVNNLLLARDQLLFACL